MDGTSERRGNLCVIRHKTLKTVQSLLSFHCLALSFGAHYLSVSGDFLPHPVHDSPQRF